MRNLLGVKIDNKLTFDYHVSDMCKKGNRKINTLAGIAPYFYKYKQKAHCLWIHFLGCSLIICP